MKKLGLLAAAAGLALGGSMAKADFVISSVRNPGPTIGTQATEIVDFTINNTGVTTGTGIASIDVALYSPSGMYVGVNSGKADVFFQKSASSQDSWIADQVGGTFATPVSLLNGGALSNTLGGSTLALGGNPSTTPPTALSTTGFVANTLVGGIAGTIYATQDTGGSDATPLWFARAVVPAGATVQILNPGGTPTSTQSNPTRLNGYEPLSGTFSPVQGGNFAASNDFATPYWIRRLRFRSRRALRWQALVRPDCWPVVAAMRNI